MRSPRLLCAAALCTILAGAASAGPEVMERSLRETLLRCEAIAGGDGAQFAAALREDPRGRYIAVEDGGQLLLQAVVDNSIAADALEALPGVDVRSRFAAGRVLFLTIAVEPGGWRSVEDVAGVLGVSAPVGKMIDPTQAPAATASTRGGTPTISQAVEVLNVDRVRAYYPELDGRGITIGVISDTISRVGGGIAASQASGDLPPSERLQVLAEGTSGIDEGRAMMEHVYDIAPGASYAFATFKPNQAAVAANVTLLSGSNCDVIVDDAFYEDEPFFQRGPIALAIEQHVDAGKVYLTAAGNYGRSCYYGTWTDSDGDNFHEIAPGVESLPFTPKGGVISITLQSDQPYVPNPTDLCYFNFVVRDANNLIVGASGSFAPYPQIQGCSLNPAGFTAPFRLQIRYTESVGTPAGKKLKVVAYRGVTDAGFGPYFSDDEGPIVAHAGIPKNMAIGAAPFFNPQVPNAYSSPGFFTILFDNDGNPDPDPSSYFKPNFLSIDQCNNTVLGPDIAQDTDTLPNFGGTSAAAPHAAGVAALMLQAAGGVGSLAQSDVDRILRDSAIGYPNDFDRFRGFGTINALGAVMAVRANYDAAPDAGLYPNHFGDAQMQVELPSDTATVAVRVPVAGGEAIYSVADTTATVDPIFAINDLTQRNLVGIGVDTRIAGGGIDDDATQSATPQTGTTHLLTIGSQTPFAGPGMVLVSVEGSSFTIESLAFVDNDPPTALGSGFLLGQGAKFFSLVAPKAGVLAMEAEAGGSDAVAAMFRLNGDLISRTDAGGPGEVERFSISLAQGEEVIVGLYTKNNSNPSASVSLSATITEDPQMPDSIAPIQTIYDVMRVNPTSGQTAVSWTYSGDARLIAFVPEVSPISFSVFPDDLDNVRVSAGIYTASGARVESTSIGQNAIMTDVAVTPNQQYFLRVVAFRPDNFTVSGSVFATQAPFASSAPLLAFTDQAGLYTATANGSIDPAGDSDYFRFTLPADVAYPAEAVVSPSSLFDVEAEVNNSIGGLVERVDDGSEGASESVLIGQSSQGRDFTLRVSVGRVFAFPPDSPSAMGTYSVQIRAVKAGSQSAAILNSLLNGSSVGNPDANGDGVVDAGDLQTVIGR